MQAVIRDRDRVLLAVRNDLRGWELPGGTVEGAEKNEAALLREVREETGLSIAVERRVGTYRRTGFRPHLAHVFLCRVLAGELRTSRESLALAWFHSLLLPETIFPWYRDPLRDAFVPEADPVEREERQGLSAIWEAARIDLGMRWRREPRIENAPTANRGGAACEIGSPARQRTRGSDPGTD